MHLNASNKYLDENPILNDCSISSFVGVICSLASPICALVVEISTLLFGLISNYITNVIIGLSLKKKVC